MSFLLKKNNAKTTINQVGGLNATDLTVIVTDASNLPVNGDFLCTSWDKETYPDPSDDVNVEIIKIIGVSGNILTIERGQEDTTGKIHANGSAFEMLITAGTFTEIEEAIDSHEAHTQGTDQKLDEGGVNEVSVVNVKDAVDKKHTQNNDDNLTHLQYNDEHVRYNIDVDLIPDATESVRRIGHLDSYFSSIWTDKLVTNILRDLTNESEVSVENVIDAVIQKHTQGTDQKLDEGGDDEVSAEEIVDHIADITNPHEVDKADVGLTDVPNLDTTDAVNHVSATENPHSVEADQVATDDSGETVQDKIDDADAHIADTANPHEVVSSQVLNTLFGQDLNGNLQPIDDYFGQGGAFELDSNYDLIPTTTIKEDLFFEYDNNNDLIPKE